MLNNDKFKTGEDFHHRLDFIFNLLVALPLLPFAILYLFNIKDQIPDPGLSESTKTGLTIVLAIAAMMISIKAMIGYKNYKNRSDLKASLRKKLIDLHDALIRKFLFLEGASFLTIMGLWLTQHKIHIVVFVVVLVLFSLKRPTVKMMVEDLKLQGREAEIIRNKELIE